VAQVSNLRADVDRMESCPTTDGRGVEESQEVRVFHGLGDPAVKVTGGAHMVERESIIGGAG